MKRFLRLALLGALLSSRLLAEHGSGEILDSLKNDISQIGSLASRVKADEPYQPYNVTVLNGPELERIGITNLLGALKLVPGVDVATDNLDNRQIVFRGSNPFAYGQSKLFVDGVEVNNKTFDSYSGFLSMPIEMIRRIEVTRGPGSMSDGVNAYAGSIRVYTYATEKESRDFLWLRGGNHSYGEGGFVQNYSVGDLHLHVDGYYKRDDASVTAGPDALAGGLYGPANVHLAKTGDAPLWMKDWMAGIRMEKGAWTLQARFMQDRRGAAFGLNQALPEHDDSIRYPFNYAETEYHPAFGSVQWHIKAGWKSSGFESRTHLLPPGFEGNIIYPEGFYGVEKVVLDTFYHTAWLVTQPGERHRLSGGYYLDYTRTRDVVTETTDRSTGIGIVDYSRSAPFIDPDASEHTWRLFVQDRYRVNDALMIQAGLNLERVSGCGTAVNPRLSAVYRTPDDNIFKAIYSRSTRAPSWQERFLTNNTARIGNPDLKMETVDAFELSYGHRFAADAYSQATLYYLNNKNQINHLNPEHIYRNASKSNLYGVELSYKTPLGLSDTFYGSYSYLYGHYDGHHLVNAAHHLIKGYLLHQIDDHFDLAVIAEYVGKKERAPSDPRPALKGYGTVDIAMGYHNFDRLSVRLTINNLFDADVRYPSPPSSYPNDYPMPGRSCFMTLKLGF